MNGTRYNEFTVGYAVWLWWINEDNQLSPKHRVIISGAENVFVSAISCWEVVLLHQRQRIELN